MSWVVPAFEPEEGEGPSGTSVDGDVDRRRDTESSNKRRKVLRNSMWTEMYAPTKIDHLAVHVKKVQEFETWLTQSAPGSMRPGPIAVIVGPSGSGKTATVMAIAKHNNYVVKEWLNPTILRTDSNSFLGLSGSTSQVDTFEEFLFRASRYQDLFEIKSPKTLLLVEDIPNAFIQDPILLERSLRKYTEVGKCPLVIICTNGSSEFNLERILFKPQMLTDLEIAYISFNPINKTLMVKALDRVLKAATRDYPELSVIGSKCVEDTAAFANGDIRCAVNHFQFLLLGEEDLTSHTTSPEEALPNSNGLKKNEPTMVAKDKAADVFRCLGAVLYNKKETVIDVNTGVATKLPTHDPEEIASKMSSTPNLFHGLLTENYPAVMSDMNSISEAANLLSQTDVMMSAHHDGDDKEINKTYAVNVAVHGLMNLPPNQVQRKFYPFKGSKLKEVNTSAAERLNNCRSLFPTYCLQPRTMLTEVCPYLRHMDIGALSRDQKNFIHEVAQLTSVSSSSRCTKVQPTRRCEDGANGEEPEVIEIIDLEPPTETPREPYMEPYMEYYMEPYMEPPYMDPYMEYFTSQNTEEHEVITIEDSSDDEIVAVEEI